VFFFFASVAYGKYQMERLAVGRDEFLGVEANKAGSAKLG
jgi:hypothetical protein